MIQRNPLAGLLALTARVALYVPTTKGDGQAPVGLVNEYRDRVARCLADLFGGYTEVTAAGGWWSETRQRLVRETIFVVYANCKPQQLSSHLPGVVRLAEEMAVAFGQEAVSLEVDGKLYFVPPRVAAAVGAVGLTAGGLV